MDHDGKSGEVCKEARNKAIYKIFESQQQNYEGRNSVKNSKDKAYYTVAQVGINFHGKGGLQNAKNLTIGQRYKNRGERE